ncbi:MAG: SufD family Fe-S cluster assembly protein [Sphingomonadaceae bacterium]
MSALPTRKDEAFRYSDTEALARVWPVVPECIIVPAGEELERAMVLSAGVVDQIDLSLGKGATAALYVLNIGGDYGRIEVNVTLHEGANFTLGGVQIGGGTQTLEIVTTITHAEPGATSRQVVRSVLADHATGTYLGKVAVARGAQQTDSEQSVKAILLDRTATANAKPELEIYADDVKCAHGAAVGELDKDALFYLAARGLPPAEAKKLMLQAFVAEVFDGATSQALLTSAALAKLGGMV